MPDPTEAAIALGEESIALLEELVPILRGLTKRYSNQAISVALTHTAAIYATASDTSEEDFLDACRVCFRSEQEFLDDYLPKPVGEA